MLQARNRYDAVMRERGVAIKIQQLYARKSTRCVEPGLREACYTWTM